MPKNSFLQSHPVILFDGECNLCNGAVNFIIDHDPDCIFRFGSLQFDAGQKILLQLEFKEKIPDTFLLIESGKVYTRSTAALRVAKKLKGGLWAWLFAFIIVPPFIRDGV